MGKIEEGCLAIVVNSICDENVGKIVTVGKFAGKIAGVVGDDQWEVDKPMACLDIRTNSVCKHVNYQREQNLQRIDDLPDMIVEEKEEEKPVAEEV